MRLAAIFQPTRQRAFTLLELLLVMGISVAIMVAVYKVYRSVHISEQSRQVAQLVEFLNRTADQATMTSNNYHLKSGDLTMGVLTQSFGQMEDTIPPGSGMKGNNVWSPWGPVTLAVQSSAGSARDLVAITLKKVPSKACLETIQRTMAATTIYDVHVGEQLALLDPAPIKKDGAITTPGRDHADVPSTSLLCKKSHQVTIVFRHLKPIDFASMRRQEFGNKLSAEEKARILPLYNRVQTAMAKREAAQESL